MDIFMKILGLIIGFGFIFIAIQFFFRGKRIIKWIQKTKYNSTSEPRQSEITFSKIIGILLFLIGIYYSVIAVLSLL